MRLRLALLLVVASSVVSGCAAPRPPNDEITIRLTAPPAEKTAAQPDASAAPAARRAPPRAPATSGAAR